MTAPKEIKVYAVVRWDGAVMPDTICTKRKTAIEEHCYIPVPYAMRARWPEYKKAGYSVRRFRLVPDDAATEMETK